MKEIRIQNTLENLRKHRIHASFVSSVEELKEEVKSILFQEAVIGVGDSVTMEQLGIFRLLKSGNYKYLDKHEENLTKEQKREIYLKNFRADYFFSGVNAVTETGHLYFIDGNGSRIAPILYGPEKIILIAGTNIITTDDEEAKK